MNLYKKTFLIGAKDPEMDVIEGILMAMEYNYIYAKEDGIRVHPTNAYKANEIDTHLNNIIFIECDVSGNNRRKGLSLDHHNFGDYGFKKSYKHFLEASSVGQLFKLILMYDYEKAIEIFDLETQKKVSNQKKYYYENKNWKYDSKEKTIIIPNRIVEIAAIDHCLQYAYNGKCKGVDSKKLLNIRITSLAANFNVAYDDILENFEFISQLIKDRREEIIDLTHINLYIGYSLSYLIIREASLYNNIPVAVKTKNDKNCNGKIMFFSLSAIQVKDIIKKSTFGKYILYDMFGVPVRGYAGGLILVEDKVEEKLEDENCIIL